MENTTTYQQSTAQSLKGSSLKEKIGIGVFLLASACIGVHFAKKEISELKERQSSSKSFQDGTPQNTASEINMALHNGIMPADIEKLRIIFSNLKSQDDYDRVANEFHKQTGKVMEDDMRNNLQDAQVDELIAIKTGKPKKDGQKVNGADLYKSWAERIKAALNYKYLRMFDAVEEDALLNVLKDIPTQRAFINVGVAYYNAYKTQVMDDLKAKLGWNYSTYLKLITDKPKA